MDVLSVVLRYDDLLADDSGLFLLDGRSSVKLLRGEAGTQHARMVGDQMLELPDSWASSQHALLEPTPEGGYQIVDQGSRNGTLVSGQRIQTAPLRDRDLVEIGHTLLCYRRIEERLARPLLAAPEGVRLGPTFTRCPELAELVRQLEAIASTREPVLVMGETGSGKEIVARALHELSRRTGAFRAIDCGAIPEGLLESVLFGHRRGAFTGAQEPRTGELVLADGGTLLLDEIANMGEASQAKFLRCLETGLVTPLGTAEGLSTDVRVLAATNRDILADGRGFRPDLLSRLTGFVARLPPLRERREDLGVLTRFFLRECGVAKASIRTAAARRLFCSGFPGNVRQLRAVLRSASVLAGEGPIELSHLPPPEAFKAVPDAEATVAADGAAPRPKPGPPEIVAALERAGGNVVQAARDLSVHPRQLYRWMERAEIDPERYRAGKG
ncbi:MAG: sigma 54-interacting transcriptional regulator [Deltaproteobacteria bacterium]|nr:sigma 54-interacting transcriptional regulator [Deltaproteobacteria bacterium]